MLLGNTITPVESLENPEINGGFRLSERIREIEVKGYKIEKDWHITKNGAKVRKYWLAKDQIIQLDMGLE
jgi:hypothetical protein